MKPPPFGWKGGRGCYENCIAKLMHIIAIYSLKWVRDLYLLSHRLAEVRGSLEIPPNQALSPYRLKGYTRIETPFAKLELLCILSPWAPGRPRNTRHRNHTPYVWHTPHWPMVFSFIFCLLRLDAPE